MPSSVLFSRTERPYGVFDYILRDVLWSVIYAVFFAFAFGFVGLYALEFGCYLLNFRKRMFKDVAENVYIDLSVKVIGRKSVQVVP
jgi:hypothetical protein